jgi:hypothetical protein
VPKNGKRFGVDIYGFKRGLCIGLQDSSGIFLFQFAETYEQEPFSGDFAVSVKKNTAADGSLKVANLSHPAYRAIEFGIKFFQKSGRFGIAENADCGDINFQFRNISFYCFYIDLYYLLCHFNS